jgi:hypothetical protein
MAKMNIPAGLHRLEIYLLKNPFKKKDTDGDYIGQLKLNRTIDLKELAESAYNRGGSQFKPEVLESAARDMMRESAFLSCDGFIVNLGGYIIITPRFKGVFHAITEIFTPGKHRLYFNAHEGELLRRERENMSVHVTGLGEDHSVIVQVIDVFSQSVDDQLTPNRNLRILGQNVRVEGEEQYREQIGVYLEKIPSSGQAALKIPDKDIVVNRPSEVMIVIPGSVNGRYRLRIVTQTTGKTKGNYLKQPVTLTHDKELTYDSSGGDDPGGL